MTGNKSHRTSDYRQSARHGAALVEFVCCLPMFFAITMGTIEVCRMIYIRQSLKIAAYECARLAIVPDVTLANVQDQCDAILQSRKVKNYTLSASHANLSTLHSGDVLTISIRTLARDNAIVGTWFFRDKELNESVSIMAEY